MIRSSRGSMRCTASLTAGALLQAITMENIMMNMEKNVRHFDKELSFFMISILRGGSRSYQHGLSLLPFKIRNRFLHDPGDVFQGVPELFPHQTEKRQCLSVHPVQNIGSMETDIRIFMVHGSFENRQSEFSVSSPEKNLCCSDRHIQRRIVE